MEIMESARLSPAPVFRLPVEIITTIFILNARNYYYHVETPRFLFRGISPNWINVSYVCRHWRKVAIDCPLLWSYVPAMSLRWMEAFLARSQRAPLKIHADFTRTFSLTRVLEQISLHVERIEVLHLNLPLSCDYQLPSKFHTTPAPRLRKLEIIGNLKTSAGLPGFSLFRGETPALKELTLGCSVPLSWHSFTLSSLTALGLHYIPTRFPLGLHELFSALRQMQFLKFLNIDCSIAGVDDILSGEAFDATPRINLPCLSHGMLTAPLSTIITFMSLVDIPLETRLTLSQSDATSTFGEYDRFLYLLSKRVNSAPGDSAPAVPTIRSLAIQSDLLKVTFLCGLSERQMTENVFNDVEWTYNSPLTVTFSPYSFSPVLDNERIICDVWGFIPMKHVRQSLFIIPGAKCVELNGEHTVDSITTILETEVSIP